MITTWYPGNAAQASQQVLGPVESQTPWTGIWRSTQLTRTPAIFEPNGGTQTKIAFADSLREIFEDLLRSGTLLQVFWINAELSTYGSRSIFRVGRAAEWNFAYDRMDDIVWSVTWDWTSRGLDQQKVTQFRDDATNSTVISQFANVAIALADSVNNVKMKLSKRTVPNSATKFSLDQIGAVLDGPNKLMKDFSQSMNRISNRITAIGDLIAKAKGLPYELASQLLDACTTATIAANNFYDAVTKTPPELLSTRQSLAALTRTSGYIKGSIDGAYNASSSSNVIAQRIQSQITARRVSGAGGNALPPPGIRTAATLDGTRAQTQTHLVRQGETLISISQLFYGVPEGAYGIAFGNGLSLKEIPRVGKVLIIPPLNTGPSQNRAFPVPSSGGQVTLPSGVGKLPGSPLWPTNS